MKHVVCQGEIAYLCPKEVKEVDALKAKPFFSRLNPSPLILNSLKLSSFLLFFTANHVGLRSQQEASLLLPSLNLCVQTIS